MKKSFAYYLGYGFGVVMLGCIGIGAIAGVVAFIRFLFF